MFLAIKTPWTCMNLNWSKWIILLDPLNFGQDIIIRIGDSRTKTQLGVCLQGSAPLEGDFLLPRACRKTDLVYKNTLGNHMKWISHRNDSIHLKLQLGKKTMAGDTTRLLRHDCTSRLNRNQFLIGSQNRNWGLGIEQNHEVAALKTGKKGSSFKQSWKL